MNKTEKQIQLALAQDRSLSARYDIMVPNCYTKFDNEADMFCIRKSGLCDEIEIKISKQDFRIDEKKSVLFRLNESDRYHTKINKREALIGGKMSNYFWYCVPTGLITADEVPEFAGLMYVDERGNVRTIKSANRLHTDKMDYIDRFKCACKMGYRFWSLTSKATQ